MSNNSATENSSTTETDEKIVRNNNPVSGKSSQNFIKEGMLKCPNNRTNCNQGFLMNFIPNLPNQKQTLKIWRSLSKYKPNF